MTTADQWIKATLLINRKLRTDHFKKFIDHLKMCRLFCRQLQKKMSQNTKKKQRFRRSYFVPSEWCEHRLYKLCVRCLQNTRKQRFFRCSRVLQKLFFAFLPKRIDLWHLDKRTMQASIVGNVQPMFIKLERTTLLPLLWHAFRNCFFAISPKRIYLRHLTKK